MNIKENKSESCIDCGYKFDAIKKYHSKNRCNCCYQRAYNAKRLEHKPQKEVETNCKLCNAEYNTLNKKGKPIIRGSKGYCRHCYYKTFKQEKICQSCGNIMKTGSITGLCPMCKRAKSMNRPNSRIKKVKLPIINKEQFELIRRLLARYKVGHSNFADAFRVIDIYMEINDNPIILDTLSESAQLVEMLRNLKVIWDYNNNLQIKKTPKQKRAEYYERNKHRLKQKRLLKNG